MYYINFSKTIDSNVLYYQKICYDMKDKRHIVMNEKVIICSKCKKQILSRDELAVVGKSFLPYHENCFNKIKHNNWYAFYSGYKTNGPYPWIMMVILNFLLWATYYLYDAPLDEVIVFSIFIVGMTLFFRTVSYLLYERYLPPGLINIKEEKSV